jgi:hypothetical protein
MFSKYRGASAHHHIIGTHHDEGSLEKGLEKDDVKHESFNKARRIEEEGRHLDFMSLLREADDASVDHPFFFFVSFEYKVSYYSTTLITLICLFLISNETHCSMICLVSLISYIIALFFIFKRCYIF